jgi:hypothetical protein
VVETSHAAALINLPIREPYVVRKSALQTGAA